MYIYIYIYVYICIYICMFNPNKSAEHFKNQTELVSHKKFKSTTLLILKLNSNIKVKRHLTLQIKFFYNLKGVQTLTLVH